MTVKELKEIVPLADVYELSESKKYIVRLPKMADRSAAEYAAHQLDVAGIRNCVIVTGNIQFYQIEDGE